MFILLKGHDQEVKRGGDADRHSPGFDHYATNVAVRLHSDVPSNSRLHPTGFAGG
jgi:hypothetical protein